VLAVRASLSPSLLRSAFSFSLPLLAGKLTAAASAAASSGDAAGAMAAEQPTYQTILASVKGSEQVKQLAADYVSRTRLERAAQHITSTPVLLF
jgi:hypothetical protein